MDAPHAPENKTAEPVEKPVRRWLKASAWAGGSLVALAVGATGALWWWSGSDGSLAGDLPPLHMAGSLEPGIHPGQKMVHILTVSLFLEKSMT